MIYKTAKTGKNSINCNRNNINNQLQISSFPAWGASGRPFESGHPDSDDKGFM